MGLLDDAIREHLELKKRHGADATEIADLERDAFGPARRAPEPLEVPGEAVVPEHEPEPEAELAEVPPLEPEAPPELEDEPPVPPQSAPQPEPESVEADLAWEDAATEPEAPARPEPEREPEPRPDAAAPTEEPDGEDLLEETPEFLEETPEHDRLWFEQRPPRDFDFDG